MAPNQLSTWSIWTLEEFWRGCTLHCSLFDKNKRTKSNCHQLRCWTPNVPATPVVPSGLRLDQPYNMANFLVNSWSSLGQLWVNSWSTFASQLTILSPLVVHPIIDMKHSRMQGKEIHVDLSSQQEEHWLLSFPLISSLCPPRANNYWSTSPPLHGDSSWVATPRAAMVRCSLLSISLRICAWELRWMKASDSCHHDKSMIFIVH